MRPLGTTQFDQCVLNMALIHLCDRESYVGEEIRNHWQDEAIENPWLALHQITIFVPHPDQEYDGLSLDHGLTKGYNVEVEPVSDRTRIPYKIPEGTHFVRVLKQKALNDSFTLAAVGLFVRSLAALKLDIITDFEKPEYQAIVVKHPIIRDYPTGWEQKLQALINQEIRNDDLPNLVGFVDRGTNRDYRSPAWKDLYTGARSILATSTPQFQHIL